MASHQECCDSCGQEIPYPVCPECGFYPTNADMEVDHSLVRCASCEPEWEPEDYSYPLGHYYMKDGQYCDGTKRILALPGNHPDAHPSSEAEANRIMDKHGINKETGFWENEKRKEAAMRVAKLRPPAEPKKKRKRMR